MPLDADDVLYLDGLTSSSVNETSNDRRRELLDCWLPTHLGTEALIQR